MEFSILSQLARSIEEFLGNDIEAEVVYGELVKVSSKKGEIIIEYKEGKDWLRRSIPVPDDWETDDWEDLADHIGDEGRFFIEGGELDNYDFD